jgi:hypothetical protein
MMKKNILIYIFLFVSSLSFGQIAIHCKYGPSLLSRGDFKGFMYEAGVSNEFARNFDLELGFSTNQYSKTQEFYYELIHGGAIDQVAKFKHINFINQLKLNGKFYFIKQKFKFSLSGGISYISFNSSTPRSLTILYPLTTGLRSHVFGLNYEDRGFKDKGIAQNLNLNFEHNILKNSNVGLSFSFTHYQGKLIWAAPLTYKINLK